MTETMTSSTSELMELTREHSAHNYHPLPVVIAEGEGVWVTDVEGRRYLDMLAAYSALNFGHRHPRLIAAAQHQLDRLTLVSRAFDHDQFGPFCAELAELAGMDAVLPMNTGAEAVETAIKVARKWGYTVKGVPADQAVIIVFGGNFHGRTTTIVSFSTDDDARAGFGPYTPGFRASGSVEKLMIVVVRPWKFPSNAMITAWSAGTPLTVYPHLRATLIAVSTASAPVFIGSTTSMPARSASSAQNGPN